MWLHFDAKSGGLQFVEKFDWVPSLGIQYFLGVDGLGLLMVLLTAIVTPLAILASWRMDDRPHVYHALILWLQAGLFGTFTALNFFHWFLFWELGLIPAFFLIKLWGGPKRGPAATQFFIYTMVGSVALLLSFLAIRLATGSFDFIELAAMAKSGVLITKLQAAFGWKNVGLIIFFGAFLGFAVKVPLIPFHTGDDVADRCHVQNGCVWFPADSAADFPRPNPRRADAAAVACGGDHRALGLRRVRSKRYQAHHRLFVHQPSRLLPARAVRRDGRGDRRE
jgi:hypothetical protein